jgi:hypothetical protein
VAESFSDAGTSRRTHARGRPPIWRLLPEIWRQACKHLSKGITFSGNGGLQPGRPDFTEPIPCAVSFATKRACPNCNTAIEGSAQRIRNAQYGLNQKIVGERITALDTAYLKLSACSMLPFWPDHGGAWALGAKQPMANVRVADRGKSLSRHELGDVASFEGKPR